MLKRIYVHNFRSLVAFEWTPPPISVVVGPNGSGKTAILEVLWLLQDIIAIGKSVDETSAPSARTSWLADDVQVIELAFEIEGGTLDYRLEIRHGNGRSELNERLTAGDALLYRAEAGKVELFGDPPSQTPRTTIPFDRRRSFLSAIEPRPDNQRIIAFRTAVARIWAMQPDPRALGAPAARESQVLERNLSNFSSWYRARVQEDPESIDLLRADLKNAIIGFVSLRLEPISPEVKELRVRFSFGGKTHELSWRELSDGQRLLVALYGMLRLGLRHASFVALDECENYVAPGEIQPWLSALCDVAQDAKVQVLVASHHPESINYLASSAAWRLWRDKDGGHTRVERLEPDVEAGETAYDVVKLSVSDSPVTK